jgi:DNA polymerase I-like protein with 3'-5' exonuclease and polymerase domains
MTTMAMGRSDYSVVDLETTLRNTGERAVGSFKASPFATENFVVAAGLKHQTGGAVMMFTTPYSPSVLYNSGPAPALETTREIFSAPPLLLVGHNIAFDLHYLIRSDPVAWRHLFAGGLKIWDTMIVEYLLSGQSSVSPSLDAVSLLRGGTIKDDRIKTYWESGMDTTDIPMHQLLPYLESDVLNTERVFLSQLKDVDDKQMLPLVQTQMEARLATIEMEQNGMYFDTAHCRVLANDAEKVNRMFKKVMSTQIRDRLAIPPTVEVSPTKATQVRAYLYGGTLKYTQRVPLLDEDGNQVLFKSGARKGEPRYTNQEVERQYSHGLAERDVAQRTRGGAFSIDDTTLKKISTTTKSKEISSFCKNLIELRKVDKDLTTYLNKYPGFVWGDGIIRPQYNHSVTGTGRLSCSSPNLQQVTSMEK